MAQDPGQDFESWARTSAALRDRSDVERAGILQQLGLGDRWPQIEAQWARTLLDDVAGGNLERVMQYGDACAQERARRARGEDAYAGVTAQPAQAVQPAPAAHPPADFRQQLHDAPRTPRAQGSTVAARDNFAAVVNPEGPAVEQPQKYQSETAAAPSVVDVMRSTTMAMGWPIEQYVEFHAALTARPEERAAIAERHGVAAEAVDAIVKGWNKKIAKDSAMRARFVALSAAQLGKR